MNSPIFYTDKPVFGFDVGHSTIKVMQIDQTGKTDEVIGYGHVNFDPTCIQKGVIVDPENMAKSVYSLFTKHIVGKIDTKRIAAALPNSSTFNRIVALPAMEEKDLDEAIKLEAEQYIPIHVDDLYIDYEIAQKRKDGGYEILIVAAPKKIVDSYVILTQLLGLELTLLQTTTSAAARIVEHAERGGVPTMIIDFGSIASDLAVYDNTVRVTGTTGFGGETLSNAIAKALKVTPRQAYTIKTRYGLDAGKKQKEIATALEPYLSKLVSEIKKMVRYYQDRGTSNRKVEQIILIGGGANLPGLSSYLTDKTRIPTRLCDPWQNVGFGKLQPPHPLETTTYGTAAGLSLAKLKGAYDD